MTIKEMRARLVAMCDTIPIIDCCTGDCPLFNLCDLSLHCPEKKCDADIAELYNEAVRQGLIKED